LFADNSLDKFYSIETKSRIVTHSTETEGNNMITLGNGFESLTIDYDPKRYKTKAAAAKALHKALTKLELELGGNESEVIIQTPKESEAGGYGKNWRVIWESGIYEWAIAAEIHNYKAGWYTEPYYSFDLCFTN
jgi:hypothetical protein